MGGSSGQPAIVSVNRKGLRPPPGNAGQGKEEGNQGTRPQVTEPGEAGPLATSGGGPEGELGPLVMTSGQP